MRPTNGSHVSLGGPRSQIQSGRCPASSSDQQEAAGGGIGRALVRLHLKVKVQASVGPPEKWDQILPEQIQWWEGSRDSCMRDHVSV